MKCAIQQFHSWWMQVEILTAAYIIIIFRVMNSNLSKLWRHAVIWFQWTVKVIQLAMNLKRRSVSSNPSVCIVVCRCEGKSFIVVNIGAELHSPRISGCIQFLKFCRGIPNWLQLDRATLTAGVELRIRLWWVMPTFVKPIHCLALRAFKIHTAKIERLVKGIWITKVKRPLLRRRLRPSSPPCTL